MKKFLVAILMSLCIIATLIGCGKKPEPTPETSSQTETESVPVSTAGVVVNNENCYMEILKTYSDDAGFYIDVVCKNLTKETNLTFDMGEVSVNNYMIDPWWVDRVKPGCVSNSTIWFTKEDLDTNNITDVTNVNFNLTVYNTDDLMSDPFAELNFDYNISK